MLIRYTAAALALLAFPVHAQVYVDASAAPGGDGSSWATAYTELRDALPTATSGEVWVAEGTYTPAPSDPAASFRWADGVAVLGGFPAGGGARDPDVHPTILSGDLAGDDGPDFANISDNSRHVVDFFSQDGAPVSASTVLDGVTVRGGNAAGGEGGGLRCRATDREPCAPTLRAVRFVANSAEQGGGAYFQDPLGEVSPRLEGVVFEGNRAVGSGSFGNGFGGGLAISGATVRLVDVDFVDNEAVNGGGLFVEATAASDGGVLVAGGRFAGNRAVGGAFTGIGGAAILGDRDGTSVRFDGVLFDGNTARAGGAVAATSERFGGTDASFARCTFVANTAGEDGGALYAYSDNGWETTITAVSSFFFGNTAALGGAVHASSEDNADVVVRVDNAVFSGNEASSQGGAVYARDDAQGSTVVEVTNASLSGNSADGALATRFGGLTRVELRNVAAWGNAGARATGGVVIDHATVEGGCPSGATCTAVSGADPLFRDADGADGVLGTPDDDLRTAGASPALDAGSAALLPPDRLDIDQDGDTQEPLPLDPADAPRVAGGTPDLGAFEGADVAFVDADPKDDRLVVGPQGRDLDVTVRVQNTSPGPISAQLWVDVVYADGSAELLLGPDELDLASGQTYGPLVRTVPVPAGAPVGDAAVRVRYGTFPDAVLADAQFGIEISPVGQLTVEVTTSDDEFDTIPNDECSLREAIESVNRTEAFGGCALAGAGSPALIQVPAGLYLLERDGFGGGDNGRRDLDIMASVRIVGAGLSATFVSADALDDDDIDRVFQVHGAPGMEVEFADLAITGGRPYSGDESGGGGVRSTGGASLTLTRVDVYSNVGGDGAGVYHEDGALRLDGAVIRDNESRGVGTIFDDYQARDGHNGGGLAVSGAGPVVVVDSRFEDNVAGTGGGVGDDDGAAGDGGYGGGLYVGVTGTTTIEGSVFTGNAAGDGGSASDGSTGEGGGGGGFAVRGGEGLTVQGTTVSGNAAGAGGIAAKSDVDSFGGDGGNGGGIHLRDVSAVLTEVSLSGNAAGRGGDGFDEGAGDGGFGGGLAVRGGDVTVERSLIAANTSGDGGSVDQASETAGDGGDGGGLFVYSGATTVTVRASTFNGNTLGTSTGTTDGIPRQGRGGAIVTRATLTLENTTVTDNATRAGGLGGGLYRSSGTTTLRNTIVAGNRIGGDATAASADCEGGASDGGFNVVGQGTGCPATAPTTETVAPPQVFVRVLDPDLEDNGGPTLTHALVTDSDNPAVDIGGTCGPLDQRGMPAPVGACDAGSLETEAGTGPALVLNNPVANAYFAWGDPINIRWATAAGAPDGPVRIRLLCSGAAPYVVSASRANDGAKGFLMPSAVGVHGGTADPDGGCRAEVALANDPSVSATSDLFVVQDDARAVAVTEPSRSDRYGLQARFHWRWDAAAIPGDSRVRLSLLCEGRDEFVRFPSTVNDGEQGYELPDDFGAYANCHAQVAAVDDLTVYGRGASFEILDTPLPSIRIVAPANNTTWAAGTTRTIRWTTESTDADVNVYVFLDDLAADAPRRVTRLALTPNDGAFTWAIPEGQRPGSQYRIRLAAYAQDGTLIRDVKTNLTITAPTARTAFSDDAASAARVTLERGWTRIEVPAGAHPVDVAAWLGPLATDGVVAARDDTGRTLVLAGAAGGDLRALTPGDAVEVWVDGAATLGLRDMPVFRGPAPAPGGVLAPGPVAGALAEAAALLTVETDGLADGDEVTVGTEAETLGWGVVRSGRAALVVRAPSADGSLALHAWRAGDQSRPELTAIGVAARSGAAPAEGALAFVAGSDWTVQTAPVAALPVATRPTELTLEPPHPNPTSGLLSLRIGLAEPAPTSVTLYDALGRAVAILADGASPEGWLDVHLDTTELAPGVYVVRVVSGASSRAASVTVIR